MPEKRLRRFRLPDMPDEPESRRARRSVLRPALAACAWMAVTGTCFALSEGGWTWAPAARGLASTTQQAPDPIAVMEERKREQAPASGAGDAKVEPAAPTVRLVSATLSPLRRQAPDTHGGTGRAFFGGLPPQPSDDGSWAADLAVSDMALSAAVSDSLTDTQQAEPEVRRAPALRDERPNTMSARRSDSEQPASLQRERQRPEPRRAAPEPPESPRAESRPRESRVWTATRMRGCEQAANDYVEELNVAEQQAPDVPRGAYARQLEDFDQYGRCDLNLEMNVSICVAVRAGKARGVTVRTSPANARLADCIASAVQSMRFPNSPRMDVVRTELIVR